MNMPFRTPSGSPERELSHDLRSGLAVGDLRRLRAMRLRRLRLLCAALGLLAVVAWFVEMGSGAVHIAASEVGHTLIDVLGVHLFGQPPSATLRREVRVILVDIRGPRALTAAAVGGGLGIAGAAMQGLFRNPLAEPGLLGTSTGAALAAACVIVWGGSSGGWLAFIGVPGAACCGAAVATAAVVALARSSGDESLTTMLLTGIAINALAGAGLGLLSYLSDDTRLRDLTLWLIGGLGATRWSSALLVSAVTVVACMLLMTQAAGLDARLLGREEAAQLGLNPQRSERRVIALSAVAVGVGVSVAGPIGFIGLVVPQIVRLLAGPMHGAVMPLSALAGASTLLLADALARTLVAPAELPVGILTALVGAPVFLYLLRRQRAGGAIR